MKGLAEKSSTCKGFEGFRMSAHDKLDECLEVLRPLFEREKSPTLQEISDALQEVKQELSGALVEGLTRELNQGLRQQETLPCPQCGPRSEKCEIFPAPSRRVTERVF